METRVGVEKLDGKKTNAEFKRNQARIQQLFFGIGNRPADIEAPVAQPLEVEEPLIHTNEISAELGEENSSVEDKHESEVPPRIEIHPPEEVEALSLVNNNNVIPPIITIENTDIIKPEDEVPAPPEAAAQPVTNNNNVTPPAITVENTDTIKPKDEFQQNQEMVEQLLLDQKFQIKMRNIIREFFAVQRTFHEGIDKFVRAFDSIFNDLSLSQQEDLQVLLQPYCMLIANPFNDYPSGDPEADLKHIVSVINKRNSHFVKILPAISLAVLKVDEFSQFLSTIKTDPKLKVAILQGIQSASWMDVESRIVLPNQRVMQYRLLLTTIEAVIMKTMEEEMAKFGKSNKDSYLSLLSPAISYILPKLNYVNNNNFSKIILLDEMDLLLNELLTMENLKQYPDFTDSIKKAKRFLDTIIQKINFNDGSQLSHLLSLWDILTGIQSNAESTMQDEQSKRAEQAEYEGKQAYYKQGFYFLSKTVSATIYGAAIYAPGQDPREKFIALMGRLKVEIRDLEIAFNAISYMTEKAGGWSPLMRKL